MEIWNLQIIITRPKGRSSGAWREGVREDEQQGKSGRRFRLKTKYETSWNVE